MCKPRTSPARKSGDRMRQACDAGLSQCPPGLPGTVVSSSGNHPPSLFWFIFSQFLPAAPSKEPHTKELHFPASSYSHACHEFVGAQLVAWGEKAALAGKECQSWSDLWDCTAVLPPDRCSCCHLTAVWNCPSLCTVYTAHTNLLCAQGRLKPFPFLCLLFALLLGSHDLLDISFHQLSSQLFP